MIVVDWLQAEELVGRKCVFLLQVLSLALFSFLGKSVLSTKLPIALRPSVRGQTEP